MGIRHRIWRMVLVLTGLAAWSLQGAAQLETRASISTAPYAPSSLVVGDFTRDGKLDVAVVNFLPSGNVTVFLGNGDGTFTQGASYAVAVQPFYAAATSLRNNGILDLIVGDSLSNYVYVMLGNGDGTFQPAVAYPTAGNPGQVLAGDFNGDGKQDVVVLAGPAAECNCVEFLPGTGDGALGAPSITQVPYNIDGFAIASGHFDNDGKLDAAVSGSFLTASQVDVLLGNGMGDFAPYGYYSLSSVPQSIAVGAFSGGRRADLAVGDYEGNNISVLLGEGNGKFLQAVNYETWAPTWVAASDLNGDGKEDLVVSNYGSAAAFNQSSVSVFAGNGDGTFQAGVVYPAGLSLSYVAVGDFNNDGMPDVVALDATGAVITLLNTGTASFSPTTPISFPTQLIGARGPLQSATLTNNGTSALEISSISNSGQPFRVQTNCKGTIAPGGTCSISAAFKADTIGVSTGTMTLKDTASSKPQFVELMGTGTEVKLAPQQLTFGPQKLDTASPPQNILVTNIGSEPFQFSRTIYVGGTDGFDFAEADNCPTTLKGGANCTIKISFRPRAVGSCTGSVIITDTGGGSPQTVSVSGTATN